jgi:hypothetical protein
MDSVQQEQLVWPSSGFRRIGQGCLDNLNSDFPFLYIPAKYNIESNT